MAEGGSYASQHGASIVDRMWLNLSSQHFGAQPASLIFVLVVFLFAVNCQYFFLFSFEEVRGNSGLFEMLCTYD